MAGIKISDLPPNTLPLVGTEQMELENANGDSTKATVADVAAAASGLDATFVTITPNVILPNERVLTAGTNVSFVDTGPNGTLTINVASVSFPLLAPDGTVGAPSYSFASDPDVGMFLVGAGILGFSVGGIEVARAVEAAGDVSLIIDPGNTATVAAPSLAFGDGDSGFRQPLDDNIQLVLVGVSRFFWELDSFSATAGTGPAMLNLAAGATSPGFIPRRSDPDTGLGSGGSDILSLIAGGVEIARAIEAGAGNNQFAIIPSGASTVPELTSITDLDTGFRWTGANEIIAINGGSRSWHFLSTSFFSEFSEGPALLNITSQLDVPTVLPNQGDSNTGLGSNGNDAMSIVAGGVEGVRVTEVAAAITVDIFGALNVSGVATFTDDVAVRDGGDIEIFDSTNTNRALLGTTLGPPDTFQISGVGDLEHFDIRSFNTSVRIRDGIPLEMEEFTLSPSFVAGSGFFWVRDDVPNVPVFTNDAGVDFVLNAPAVSPDPLLLSSGGVAVPTYSFAVDTDTGMFNPGPDILGLTAGGVEGMRITEVAGAISVEIQDNLTIDAPTGPGPHLSFINVAPGAAIIDVLPTGSTNYNFATLRDQAGTNFFFIRHDYSLSSANHRLDFSSDAHNDILRLSSSTQQVAMIQQNYFFDETSFHITATKFLEFDERAGSPVPGAGDGAFWVRDDAPNVPMFTDDVGVDFVLNTVSVPGGVNTAIQFNNAGAFGGSPDLEWDGSEVKAEASQAGFIADESDGGGASFFRATSTSTGDSGIQLEFDSTTGVNARIRQVTPGGSLEDIWISFAEDAGVGIRHNDIQKLLTIAGGVQFDDSLYVIEKAAANADIAAQGQFWVRDDVPNIPMFTDDVGTDFKLGVANDAVQARRTTSFTITTAFTDVTLDTTDIETDSAIIEHSATTDRIEAQVAGTYEITYGADIDPSAAGNDNIRAFGRVRLNDAGVDLPGSLASTSAYEDASTIGNSVFGRLQCSFIVVLAAGDFVTLQLMKVETGGTGTFTAEEVTVTAKRLL